MIKKQGCSRGVREVCRLLGYSPQAYYQYQRLSAQWSLKEELVIAEIIRHRIVQPKIGCRKLQTMLEPFMRDHQIVMGRDLLFDLLRDYNLLIRKKRRKQPVTTDSRHWMRKYPNLIKDKVLSRADELWVSDITYIQLAKSEFGYLSLITDAYSRKIVGFCMNANLTAAGPINALQMALKGRVGIEPLIHHSDRGAQYCSDNYVNLLNKSSVSISMTQSGNPKDNAIAERVNGILKQELLMAIYPDIKQARQAVSVAVDVYNRLRPHSSIDMLTPERAHNRTGMIVRRWKLRNFQQKKEAR